LSSSSSPAAGARHSSRAGAGLRNLRLLFLMQQQQQRLTRSLSWP
jgi:hypothetical protein